MENNIPAPEPQQPKEHVRMLELEEYLFAATSAKFAQDHTPQEAADHIRGSLRMHRFMVFSWLMLNGAHIPVHLMDDRVHRPVGEQAPDLPAKPGV
jgi:hypothetical protein